MGRILEESSEIIQPLTYQAGKAHIGINNIARHFAANLTVTLEGVVTPVELFAAMMKSKLGIGDFFVQTNIKNLGGITHFRPQGKGFVVVENAGYLTLRIVYVTKNDGSPRAGVHANRRQATSHANDTEITLVGDIAWIAWISTIFRQEMARIIGTGHHAGSTTNTTVIPLQHVAVGMFEGRFGRAVTDAGRVVTLVTQPWQNIALGIGEFPSLRFHQPDA